MVDAREILVGLLETCLYRNHNDQLSWSFIENTGINEVRPELAEAIEEFIEQEGIEV